MNGSAPGQVHLAVVGATGMVGGYVLRYALDHPSVGLVTAIGRRKLGISHPKLKEVLHQDFADCTALAGALSDQNAAVFCLGVYTGAVPDAEFRKITVDYTVEFARVLQASSPDAAFSFLSGMVPTRRDAAACLLHAIKERPKRRCLGRDSHTSTYSGPPTSTLWSRGRSRISVTDFSVVFTRCFGCCSPTK